MNREAAIILDRVSVTYGHSVRAMDDVSLTVPQGETVGLVGESGSGKSTLCRILLGLTPETSGTAAVLGQPVRAARAGKIFRRNVQMLMQDAVATLSPRFTVDHLLMEAVSIHGLSLAETRHRVLTLLDRLRLPPSILQRYPHQVSGGQARRIGVIRALLLQPRLLIADEPTAGLDISVQGELLNLLLEFQREMSLTFLMVSHNLHVVKRVTRRTIVMYLGQIVEDAPTRSLFERPAHPYAAALLSTGAISAGKAAKAIVLNGEIPSNIAPPPGCRFHTRCPVAQQRCRTDIPDLAPLGDSRHVRCHFPFALALPTVGASAITKPASFLSV